LATTERKQSGSDGRGAPEPFASTGGRAAPGGLARAPCQPRPLPAALYRAGARRAAAALAGAASPCGRVLVLVIVIVLLLVVVLIVVIVIGIRGARRALGVAAARAE